MRLLLVPSPLLGPATWRPAAAVLAELGHEVSLVPHPERAPQRAQDVLDQLRRHLPREPFGVVVHSNAGLHAPHLPAAVCVFVDAALPPAAGEHPLAPAQMHPFLRKKADATGLLPPWTVWWDDVQLAPLFPDVETRAAVAAEQHRLPLSYFTSTLRVQAGWETRPAAYLAFGDTYAEEQARARQWGWPVTRLDGAHLHQLVDPRGVADAVHLLLSAAA